MHTQREWLSSVFIGAIKCGLITRVNVTENNCITSYSLEWSLEHTGDVQYAYKIVARKSEGNTVGPHKSWGIY